MAKKVTAKSIASRLGISPTTVSFVLNGRTDKGISEATRARVLRTALKMGFKRATQPLASGWRRVAYLAEDLGAFSLGNTFYAGVYEHVRRGALERSIEVMLVEFRGARPAEARFQHLRELKSLGYDAFFTSDDVVAAFLIEKGERVVLITRPKRADCICVGVDDYGAGRLAAEHALSMGHRRAGIITPVEHATTERARGFRKAFSSGGGEVRASWVVHAEFPSPETHREVGRGLSRIGKAKLPSLFYCYADFLVLHAIRALADLGLAVPDDVSLIGTDNLLWGRAATPAFTTVDLSEETFAERLLEAVAQIVDGPAAPYHVTVPVRLLARETVRDVKRKRSARKRRASGRAVV